jgi:hypothetical protein
MDNDYFDLMEYCKNPEWYKNNLKNPTTVCSVIMFIKGNGGIIDNEEQFAKRIDQYICEYGMEAGHYLMGLMIQLYPNIINSDENKAAFNRSVDDWYLL